MNNFPYLVLNYEYTEIEITDKNNAANIASTQ